MLQLNKAVIAGNLGRDPEERSWAGGKVATINVATNEEWKDKDGKDHKRTEWHRVHAFGKLAELWMRKLKKGSCVYVEGKIRTDAVEGEGGKKKYYTSVVADVFKFNDPPQKGEGKDAPSEPAAMPPPEDDLPF